MNNYITQNQDSLSYAMDNHGDLYYAFKSANATTCICLNGNTSKILTPGISLGDTAFMCVANEVGQQQSNALWIAVVMVSFPFYSYYTSFSINKENGSLVTEGFRQQVKNSYYSINHTWPFLAIYDTDLCDLLAFLMDNSKTASTGEIRIWSDKKHYGLYMFLGRNCNEPQNPKALFKLKNTFGAFYPSGSGNIGAAIYKQVMLDKTNNKGIDLRCFHYSEGQNHFVFISDKILKNGDQLIHLFAIKDTLNTLYVNKSTSDLYYEFPSKSLWTNTQYVPEILDKQGIYIVSDVNMGEVNKMYADCHPNNYICPKEHTVLFSVHQKDEGSYLIYCTFNPSSSSYNCILGVAKINFDANGHVFLSTKREFTNKNKEGTFPGFGAYKLEFLRIDDFGHLRLVFKKPDAYIYKNIFIDANDVIKCAPKGFFKKGF